MSIAIHALTPAELTPALPALAELLAATVNGGASVGFMQPLSLGAAQTYWQEAVQPGLQSGERLLWQARQAGQVLGTVQLLVAMPANQSHRCEIAKLMVAPQARRRGVGRQLMLTALQAARDLGRSLVTLDTRHGDPAQALYTSLGFELAGLIPDYAWDPDGRARHATAYMYRRMGPA